MEERELDTAVDRILEFGKRFKPAPTRCYVILDQFQESVGGVLMPELHSEQSRIGTVIAVGDGVTYYQPGDRIITQFHLGVKLHLLSYYVTDEKFRVLHEDEILGTIYEGPLEESEEE